MSVLQTAVIIARGDRRRDTVTVGVIGRHPEPVAISPELAPTPQPDTAFYAQGRDAAHAWPRTPVEPNRHLGIADILSHMAPNFLFPKVPSAMVVGQGFGAQLPTQGRPNIDPIGSTSYGSLAALQPDPTWNPVYQRLRGG